MDDSFYHDLNFHPLRHSTTTIADEVIHKDSTKACTDNDPSVTGSSVQGSSEEIQELFGRFSYSSAKDSTHDLTLHLMYFPDIYRFKINNQPYNQYLNNQGLVLLPNVQSEKGINLITWTIQPTPIHKLAYLLTIIGFSLSILYPIIFRNRN